MNVIAWPFLIGRNKTLGYQVVVSPDFLSKNALSYLLPQVAGGDDSPDGHATLREIHGTQIGDISVIFRIIRPRAQDYGLRGTDLLRDRDGRPIRLIEGIVIKGEWKETNNVVLLQEYFQNVHNQLKEAFRIFWKATQEFPERVSQPFDLVAPVNAHKPIILLNIGSPLEINQKPQQQKSSISVPLPLPLPSSRLKFLSPLSSRLKLRFSLITLSIVLLISVSMIYVITSSILNKPPTPTPTSPSGIYITLIKGVDNFQIARLDPKTKRQLWSQDIGNITFKSRITIVGQTIYFSSSSADYEHHYVYALNTKNGKIIWHTELGNQSKDQPVSIPTPKGWTSYLPQIAQPHSEKIPFYLGTLTTPTIANGSVYVIATSGKIFVLNAANGMQQWMYDTSQIAMIGSTLYNVEPVIINQGVMYSTILNKLYAIDVKTHKELWSKEVNKDLLLKVLQVENNVIYTGAHERNYPPTNYQQKSFLYTFDVKDGSLHGNLETNNGVLSAPLIVQNTVYFGSDDHNVYALQASAGKEQWHFNTGGYVFNTPIFVNNVIYIQRFDKYATYTASTVQSTLFALDANTGKMIWKKDGINGIVQVVQGGIIYAGQDLRIIYAYSTKDGSELWHQGYGSTTTDLSNNDYAPPLITVIN
jgi:outer membrane protein assembly factor BamB